MSENVTSLKTRTPEEGFKLAITLARKGVEYVQPNAAIRKKVRSKYEKDPDNLMFASQVIAIHFQTVAAANNYWK